MKRIIRVVVLVAICVGIGAAIYAGLQPRPVDVDVAGITRGPLVVMIRDDGRTRIRERYVVSSPLGGRLVRIELKPGDAVIAHETYLSTIEPTDPALLDPRAVALAEARVKTAEARLKQTTPRAEAVQEALKLAEAELDRVTKLQDRSATTQQEVDEAQTAVRQASFEYDAASFDAEIAQFELQQAKAALTRTGIHDYPNEWNFPIRSPISGCVLRVFQESSTVVNAGDRILELGDPTDLEVEVDVLSTDAVRIRPGARVELEHWGGDRIVEGRVRRIEPSAFTKISALGIEEQRVNVIIDFVHTNAERPPLGDGYRVEAAIVEWESDDVLTVPTGALFRVGTDWAVYLVSNETAERKTIRIGHRNDDFAEVLEGLRANDSVILYPGDRVHDGAAISIRTQ